MADDAYEPSAPPAPPPLPGRVTLRPTADDLFDALSADLLIHAFNCVRAFGDVHLALSGGSTPLPFYQRLMIDPDCRAFPWDRAHLWIVDERRVPFDDELSNFAQVRDILVEHSDIPRANVHPIRATDADADTAYERELVTVLGARGPGKDRLDFCLLGMGADAHTASLFPRSPALSEARRLVRINAGPTVTPPDRVTMTLPIINASRFIAVLVTGAGKRETLARVSAAYQAEQPRDRSADRAADPASEPRGSARAGALAAAAQHAGRTAPAAARVLDLELPILNVRPLGSASNGATGELRWCLDHAACP